MKKINIVLFEPEIPGNTANIIRTCVGTNAVLHLIKPYGFDFNLADKVFKRGSTNYFDSLKYFEYENFEEFCKKNPYTKNNYFLITRYGEKIYTKMDIKKVEKEAFIIFGKESLGIPKKILQEFQKNTYRLPASKNVRSLNLSNCVMTITYEALRQLDFEGLDLTEPHKINHLKIEEN